MKNGKGNKYIIPMETTMLGTILELYLRITLVQNIATILFIHFQICLFIFRASEINMIIYFRLPLDPLHQLQVKEWAQE